MRISFQYAFGLLALVPLLQGCDHKTAPAQQQPQVLAPPIEDTPPPKPAAVSTADLPPPVLGTPPVADNNDANVKPAEPAKKPVHRKKPVPAPSAPDKQETASATPAAASPATAPAEAPSVSAAGNLTSTAPGGLRTQTEDQIAATEKGLNGITRTLSDSEAKTAAQIREFLKQAREALSTGDVDGANTLVVKAKVLLTELNQ